MTKNDRVKLNNMVKARDTWFAIAAEFNGDYNAMMIWIESHPFESNDDLEHAIQCATKWRSELDQTARNKARNKTAV
jgi:hypothetical protein